MPEGVPSTLARSQGLDTLELDTGHWAFRHGGPLLKVLKDELSARGADKASPVRPGVVRQPPSVGDALNHLKNGVANIIYTSYCVSVRLN